MRVWLKVRAGVALSSKFTIWDKLYVIKICFFIQKTNRSKEVFPLPGHGVLEVIDVSKSIVLEKC